MADDGLTACKRKRRFDATPEPAGSSADPPHGGGRFVVQEHHATRLHWDLRLERDGVLASWAVPNGIPPDPKDNRLAVRTEDHPLEYLSFEGEIPKGEYGAGTVRIWDAGTFETIKWSEDKVEVTFAGERLQGRYGLFAIGREAGNDDWMIHRMDPPADPNRRPVPERIVPMLARPAHAIPSDEAKWSFEVKWDGIRAIAYTRPGRLRLESRSLREVTDSYPEVRGLLCDLGMHEAVLDGELVAFDKDGRPSFERLQRRMHPSSAAAVRRLAASIPVVYAIFDLLYLDGRILIDAPYEERRELLESLRLSGPAWRVPAAYRGEGRRLLEATARQGLEGVIAKRLGSRYEPGRRSGSWLKIKHTLRQELVIGGWLPGEGWRTDRIGALLMGHRQDGTLVYAGRVGTGFAEATLDELAVRLAPLRRSSSPFGRGPKLPRNVQFVEPRLLAEVEFCEWTEDGVMRAPAFKGLRDEGPARKVALESERLFERVERLPDGARLVVVDGREIKVSNWDKVLFPRSGFTKGDLVSYCARVAPAALPHLRDRALTLKRYPDGVEQEHFYEKQAPSHRPRWVETARVGGVEYTLCQDRPTLVWLANLANIELHTSLSLAREPERPTMLVFDLDPGAPAGIVQCCEVAEVLRGLFGALGLESFAKTSGSKGMQVCVPLNTDVTYRETKPFARRVAELLAQRLPELVVSRMTRRLRAGRVLVDWSQNDAHKTTVAPYSVRARERPVVSTPVTWEEVVRCRADQNPALLEFDTDAVLRRIERDGDLFAPLQRIEQRLPAGG